MQPTTPPRTAGDDSKVDSVLDRLGRSTLPAKKSVAGYEVVAKRDVSRVEPVDGQVFVALYSLRRTRD